MLRRKSTAVPDWDRGNWAAPCYDSKKLADLDCSQVGAEEARMLQTRTERAVLLLVGTEKSRLLSAETEGDRRLQADTKGAQ